MKLSLTSLAFTAGFLALGASAQAVIVYDNDFTGGAGSEWSTNTTAVSNGERFLAASPNGFGAGTDTLSLSALPAHSTVTLSFDLYIIQSWDGNGPNGGGVDGYRLTTGGLTLLDTTFANYTGGNTQAYTTGNPTGPGTNAPRSGAFDNGHLGFGTGDFGDSTYRFTFTFASTASALAFDFSSLQSQAPGDEGWGLDNVSVSLSGVPSAVPGPVAALPFAVGLLRRRRRG